MLGNVRVHDWLEVFELAVLQQLEDVHLRTQKRVHIGWLLEFYTLTTFKVISGQVPTCGSAHSWRLYSAAPMGTQAISVMI